MVFQRQTDDYTQHIKQCVEVIRINLEACLQGKDAASITISTQLFKLLCDKKGGQRLIERVVTDFSLHPIRGAQPNPKMSYLLFFPWSISYTDNTMVFEVFDKNEPKIHVVKWLEQILFISSIEEEGVSVTLEDFIQVLRNTEGAHYLPRLERKQRAVYAGLTIHLGDKEYRSYYLILLMIANYVIEEIELQMG